MKKIRTIALTALAVLFAVACFAGCAKQDPGAQVPNPVTEYKTAQELKDATGIAILLPDDADSAVFTSIKHEGGNDIAQADFIYMDAETYVRQMKNDSLLDISGLFYEFKVEKDVTISGVSCKLLYSEGEQGFVAFYSEVLGQTVNVCITGGATEALLSDLAEQVIAKTQNMRT